jgi:hypothetical protein
MRVRTVHKWLLIVALALTQWLAIAHAAQHPALASADHVCQLCNHAQGLDAGAAPVTPELILGPADSAAPALPAASARAGTRPQYRIRAPPLLVR